jgi:hypothetical protein
MFGAAVIGDRHGALQVDEDWISAEIVVCSRVLTRDIVNSCPLTLNTAFAVTGRISAAQTVEKAINMHARAVRFIPRPPTIER